jgi:hypothetical protein
LEGIEVKVVMLLDDVRQAVRRAQERQFRWASILPDD